MACCKYSVFPDNTPFHAGIIQYARCRSESLVETIEPRTITIDIVKEIDTFLFNAVLKQVLDFNIGVATETLHHISFVGVRQAAACMYL